MSAFWKKKKKERGGGHFLTPKVSVFMEIGVFFSLKNREKGSFFKSGNADTSSLSYASAGTGVYIRMDPGIYMKGAPGGPHKLSVGRGCELGADKDLPGFYVCIVCSTKEIFVIPPKEL